MEARPFARLSLITLALAAQARAGSPQQSVHQAALPVTSLPFTAQLQLPAFDPALGVLRQVQVHGSSSVYGTLALENTGPQPITFHAVLAAFVQVGLPSGGGMGLNPAFEIYLQQLTAYDGSFDWAGTSGMTLAFGPAGGTGAPSQDVFVFTPAALASWVASSPGQQFTFSFTADEYAHQLPPIAEQHSLQAAAGITITYTYDPLPAQICQASPALGCPCGNWSLNEWGCGNSASAPGALLAASGAASLSGDTLLLQASGMPNSTSLFFQGTSFTYTGVTFGDGMRCVGGTIQRLGAKVNSAGTSQYPQPGDLSVSVRGGVVQPGSVRYYQTQYRDSASFCTAANSNVTSGVAILWGP